MDANAISTIYVLSAVDIRKKTKQDLMTEFEIAKLNHPVWKTKSYEEFLKWKTEFHETRFDIETYDTAYFTDPEIAREYARSNMTDINECGAYPYLAVYSRPTNTMYAEANHCTCEIFEYDDDNDRYRDVKDETDDIRYKYIRAAFDHFTKLPEETICD